MADLAVLYNGGAQLLRVVPVDLAGKPVRPSSATYGVADLRRSLLTTDREVVAAGTAATVHSFSQTTTAAAGMATADPRVVTVASTTGVSAGHRLMLTNLKGDRELLTVDSVTATTVRARADLVKSYPTGSSLQGVEVICTFPEAEAADEQSLIGGGGPYALDLSLVGTDRPTMRVFVELVRQRGLPLCSIEDLAELDAVAATIGGDRIDPYAAVRRASFELTTQLRLAGIDPNYAHFADAARLACSYLAGWHVLKTVKGDMVQARAADYAERARGLINAMINSRNVVGAATTSRSMDTAPSPGPVAPAEAGRWERA